MKAHESPDSVAVRMGQFDEPAGQIPVGPGGVVMLDPTNYAPQLGPPHTADYCPCERDCRHYFRVTSHFEVGNAAGSLPAGYEPRQHHRCCTAQAGVYLELTGDAPVLECNRWDPMTPSERDERATRRLAYFATHPISRAEPAAVAEPDPYDDDDKESE